MIEQCPKCGAKRLSRPYVSAYDPADEWSCGTSRGHFSGVAEGNACLKNQLAARDAELAEARAEIERLGKLQERLVADFVREMRAKVDAWSRLASSHFDCGQSPDMKPVDREALEREITVRLTNAGVKEGTAEAAIITAKAMLEDHANRLGPTLYRREYCDGVMNGFQDAYRILDCVLGALKSAPAPPAREERPARPVLPSNEQLTGRDQLTADTPQPAATQADAESSESGQ